MGLVSQELSTALGKPGPGCSACTWLANTDQLDDEDRQNIIAWIEAGKPIEPMWRVLKKRGLPTSIDSFRRYHCRERHHEHV